MDRNQTTTLNRYDFATVALRKESVDRNTGLGVGLYLTTGRSPQGERG